MAEQIGEGVFAAGDAESSDEDVALDSKATVGGVPLYDFTTKLFASVVDVLAAGNKLPRDDDYGYHSSFRNFPREMKAYADVLLKTVEDIAVVHTGQKRKVDLRSIMDERDRVESVVDVVDGMLETVDGCLDRISAGQDGRAGKMSKEERMRDRQMRRAEQSKRPQASFKRPPDNSHAPFRPLLFKPDGSLEYGEPGSHPYKDLIMSHQILDWQTKPAQKRPFMGLDDVPCHFIDTPDRLKKLNRVLLSQDEFAVDLEAHSFHSYLGFVCLMQLSTRQEDYIVDALALREHMHLLLPAFVNPKVVKVFHGASSDIEWLQRDFGLYVVNMFDTGIAAQQLCIQHSLGYLLLHFCDVSTDKRFQLADWRQRPLSPDMHKYARMDTHYLLFIADQLRNRLLMQEAKGGIQNPLMKVMDDSRRLCTLTYRKPSVEEQSRKLLGRCGRLSEKERVAVMACLRWRDEVARSEDESPQKVLSGNAVLSVGQEAGNQTMSAGELCKLFSPTPPLMRRHVAKLVAALAESAGSAPPATQDTPEPTAEADESEAAAPHGAGWVVLPTADEKAEFAASLPSVGSVAAAASPLCAGLRRAAADAGSVQRLLAVLKQERAKRLRGVREVEDEQERRRVRLQQAAARLDEAPAAAPQQQEDLGEVASFSTVPGMGKKLPPSFQNDERLAAMAENAKKRQATDDPPTSLKDRYRVQGRRKVKLRRKSAAQDAAAAGAEEEVS